MKRHFAVLGVALIVITSGCSGFSFLNDNQGVSSTSTPATSSSVDNTSNNSNRYTIGTDTDQIVLQLSDLSGKYNFTSEVNESSKSVTGDRRQTFENKGILKQHKRVFTREQQAKDVPFRIISTAVIYKTEADAKSDLNSSIQQLTGENGKVSQATIGGSISVYIIKWEDREGFNHTVIYRQNGNLLYYVFSTAADNYYTQKMRQLLQKMAYNAEI